MHLNLSKLVLFLSLSSACAGLTTHIDQKPIQESKDAFDLVRHALRKAEIIEEVIDDFQPKCFVTALYNNEQKPVALGNKFKKPETKEKPALRIYCPNIKSTPGLILALTDPDAPSRSDPKWAEMCHWIAVVYATNQTGIELELDLDITSAPDLVEYKPPGPPPKTGYHRYVFLLLEGVNTNLTVPEDRQHWGTGKKRHGVRDWAKNEGLAVVGANFFVERTKK
ncbi:hypothetical protein EG329_007475 [Mollisiaceae sp. DMI_Dod_QoI]|nr:hypothetical protein EG329_007475 [Helotiales sp. DMI_Dod_QoI]